MNLRSRVSRLEADNPPDQEITSEVVIWLPKKDPPPDGSPDTSPLLGDTVFIMGQRRTVVRVYQTDAEADTPQVRAPHRE